MFLWKIELYVSCTVFVREELSDNVCCLGQCLTVINIKALLASFEIFWAKLALAQLINAGLPFTAHILLRSYQYTIDDNVCIAFHSLVSKRYIYLYLTKILIIEDNATDYFDCYIWLPKNQHDSVDTVSYAYILV